MSEHEIWNELGNLCFMSSAYDQAVYAYHRSIQLDSSSGRPYSNLALAYVQQGKYEQAIQLYKRSLELLADDKDKAISWNRLGNVYGHLKDYQQAFLAYQQADDLDPASRETREGPDRVLYHSLDPDSSLSPEDLMQALHLVAEQYDPTGAAPQATSSAQSEGAVTLTWIPADSNPSAISDAPESESFLIRAEPGPAADEDDPELSSVMEQETEVYFAELDDQDLADWLPLPGAPDARQELENGGTALSTAEDQQTSEAGHAAGQFSIPSAPLLATRVEAAREQEHSDPMSQFSQVDLDGRSEAAFMIADQPEDEPNPAEAEHSGDQPEAAAAELPDLNIELEIPKLKRLVQVNPYNAVTWNTLGNLYRSAGLYKEAIQAYQQATSIDPAKSEYYHNLGLVYGADGRDEDAIIVLQKVLELNPDHSLTHATLGGYYRKMGLDELAQKHIGRAMKHIYDSESEYNRACLEAICGNADQAIELLRIALQNKQTYVDWVLRDPDLDAIREDRRFKQLISDFT